jgi:predicted nucleotidyltransferase
MGKGEALEKVNKFAEKVIEKYHPKKIILFGSYAKGDFRDGSDIDVAVIVDKIDGSFIESEAGLYKIRRNIDENIEPILFEEGNDRSGFLENILNYGEIVYQR